MVKQEFKLRPGDILVNVSGGKDLWSRIERCAIGEYSHVFMYLGKIGFYTYQGDSKLLRVPMLFEANHDKGVCLRLLSERYGEEVVAMRLTAGYDKVPHVIREAIKLASDDQARYDFACIPLNIIPRILHEKLGMPVALKYQRNEQMICSEAVYEVVYRASVNLLPIDIVPLPSDFITSPLLHKVWGGVLGVNNAS